MDKSGSHFTLFDLAKALDVKKGHIRLCEENGLIAPRTIRLNRRAYTRYDRERLKSIFRFVLLGYSKEQIIEMIGPPDGNSNENDRLAKEITYVEAKIEALETQKENSSFTKQTRIMSEIEMLRDYVDNVKAIKTSVDEKSSEKAGIESEAEAEGFREPKQHPIKIISVFIAGLMLVILIGSFFYYRTGKVGTKTVKPVQERVIPLRQH
jgi:DNA-binding transcriptional MerR regulator